MLLIYTAYSEDMMQSWHRQRHTTLLAIEWVTFCKKFHSLHQIY